MFIDVHSHAFKKHPPVKGRDVFSTPEQVLEIYDRMDIEKGALLPVVSPEVYFPQSNEYILEVVDKYPDRFFPFCNVDPRSLTNSPDADFEEVLLYYKNLGCKGLGEVMPNLPILDPMVQNLFRYAEKVGLPVIFDMQDRIGGIFGLYDQPGLPGLEHTLQRFPDLKIIGHGPAFWAEIGRLRTPADRSSLLLPDWSCIGGKPEYPVEEEGVVPHLFRRYNNLYGDLSSECGWNALARDVDYAVSFLEEFQDRLFFGTDICGPDTPLPLAGFLINLVEEGKISEVIFKKVAKENAVKFFNL